MTEVTAKVTVVQICPPGRAVGADDLQRWSSRRAGGRSGAGIDRAQVCRKCKTFFEARKKHLLSEVPTAEVQHV